MPTRSSCPAATPDPPDRRRLQPRPQSRPLASRHPLYSLGLLFSLLSCLLAGQTQELRGLWIDAFHPGFKSATEVRQLIADARAGHFNALFVQVRKRGDAYYRSTLEPEAADIPLGFDPLAELIRQAHDPQTGPRLEVHAWIVAFNIWNRRDASPVQPDHPFVLHPDWLTRSATGETWDGANYAFDPGLPAVQEHTCQVALDLVRNYNLDGLHWDYIRYAGREWGYHPAVVDRFNHLTGSTGTPAPDDSTWMQFRRDQVTQLVRRVYLGALVLKPQLKLSAATITWTPSATTYAQWLESAAYSDVLQDWRGWLEEGILDLNIPMAYFRQESHATAWSEWSRFARASRFQRQVALGVGAYLNTVSNTLVQLRSTRLAQPSAPRADGLLVYSYAAPAKDGSRAAFLAALTQPSPHDSNPTPVFSAPVVPPAMPWKTNGSFLGLHGSITDVATGRPIPHARLEICLPPQVVSADANGAYGILVPAATPSWNLIASAPGYEAELRYVPFLPGHVATADFALRASDPRIAAREVRISVGTNSALVSWTTETPTHGEVILGLGSACHPDAYVAPSLTRPGLHHTVWLAPLHPTEPANAESYRLRIRTWTLHQTNLTDLHEFRPAWPSTMDDDEARCTGRWTYVASTSTGSVNSGYRRTTTVAGSASATLAWEQPIHTPGRYWAYVLHPRSTSSPAQAVYELSSRTGLQVVTLNQSHGGGQWRTLATNLTYQAGDVARIRLRNNAGPAGATLFADAVRLALAPGQDPPPPGQVPEWWHHHYFRQPPDPGSDPDADGLTNASEFLWGTDPTHPDSHCSFQPEGNTPTGFALRLSPSHPTRRYRLLRASGFPPARWELVVDARVSPTGTGGARFTDPLPFEEQAFYRLEVQP